MNDRLTKSDIRKMEQEIEHRKLVERKEALEAVKIARAHGDLSENFEYYAAKRDKNANESRIRYLERMIRTAHILEEESEEDEVGLNNTVTLLFLEDNEVEKYKIVTTVRENVLEGRVSIESPIGKAVMGQKINSKVHVQVNETYGYDVLIQGIENTEETENDTMRGF